MPLDWIIRQGFSDPLGTPVAETFVTGLVIPGFGNKALHFGIGFGMRY